MHAPRDRRSGGGAAGDDSSQLIDLRTLSRMAEATTASAGSAHRLAIPRFAASDLTRIPATSTPLLPPPSFIDLPLRRPAEDRAPLYALLAALTVAVSVLGAFVILRPRPEVVVDQPPQPLAPSVLALDRSGDRQRDDAPALADADDERAPDPSQGDVEGTPAAEAAIEPPSTAKASPKTRRRAREAPTTPRSPPRESTKDKPARAAELTADCVLGLADCGETSTKKKPPSPTPRAAPREDLPAKLTMTQLRTGVSKQKPAAKQCGRSSGAAGGEEVRVRLSISGSSGAVVSAAPQGEHARTELGRCVATALAKAKFPRFGDPAMGFLFTVRM